MLESIRELPAMLENHPGVHSETVQVRLSEFADSSIDIAVQFYTKTTDIVEKQGIPSASFPSWSAASKTRLWTRCGPLRRRWTSRL